MFSQSPDPQELLDERPTGTLGPRYTITYVMPGPNNDQDTLVQDVYPYAEPDAVTYTEPGQRFWTTERTHGGWYLASWYLASSLKDQLVAAGLPPNAPTGDDGFPLPLAGILAAAAVLALGGLAAFVIRRRPDAATAG